MVLVISDPRLDKHIQAVPIDHPDGSITTAKIADRAVTREKLEYPTENVSFSYLSAINKVTVGSWGVEVGLLTMDIFTDKRVLGIVNTDSDTDVCTARWNDGYNYYRNRLQPALYTRDHDLGRDAPGASAVLAWEAVDLPYDAYFYVFLQATGSTITSRRSIQYPSVHVFDPGLTLYTISATDTWHASGRFGVPGFRIAVAQGLTEGWLLPPASSLPKAMRIIETDIVGTGEPDDPYRPEFAQNLVEVSTLTNIPDFLRAESKRYEILRARGFTDEEIKILLGRTPQRQIDLLAVTWGSFDFQPGKASTAIVVVTGDNPYKAGAVLAQEAATKAKGLKVFAQPKNYSEALAQYNQLKRDHPEWLAGKDNYAYQVLGYEELEPLAVADFYHGFLIDHQTEPQRSQIKQVPDWELRNTINMWLDRLEKAKPKLKPDEYEKHKKKLEDVLKIGW